MTIYSSIISLGGNCEVTHQIRRRFGIEAAYPFDWWITPLPAVATLFREGPNILFNLEDLDPGPAKIAVKCLKTGILHHHDFRRDDDELVLEDIVSQLDDLRQKYRALWLRLDQACSGDGKVLFVRGWCDILHYPDDAPKHAETVDFDFSAVISSIADRYPLLDFDILFANYGEASIADRRAIFVNVSYDGPTDWRGSNQGWDEVYARLDATLEQKP